MTFAASASPTRCEPGSRSRLLPDKATISTPFFRCCVDAGAFSDSFVDRRVAVLCGVAIYNLLSFSVPPLVFLSINFLYVKANFPVVIENQHEPARSSPRFYDDLPVLPNERLSLICFKSPRL